MRHTYLVFILMSLLLGSCSFSKKVNKTKETTDSTSVSKSENEWVRSNSDSSRFTKEGYTEILEFPNGLIFHDSNSGYPHTLIPYTEPRLHIIGEGKVSGDTTINNYFTNPVRIIRQYYKEDGTQVKKSIDSGYISRFDSLSYYRALSTVNKNTSVSWPWYVWLIIIISVLFVLDKAYHIFTKFSIIRKA